MMNKLNNTRVQSTFFVVISFENGGKILYWEKWGENDHWETGEE